MLPFKSLSLVLFMAAAAHGSGWTYVDDTTWCTDTDADGNAYTACCPESTAQSPIDLSPGGATYMEETTPFSFSAGYINRLAGVLINNGHSLKFTPNADETPLTVSGGSLAEEYTLAQWHVHWGNGKGNGSEHTVDGMAYEGELHLVHFKSSHGDLGTAVASGETDALAVLGFFLEQKGGKDTSLPGLGKATKKLVNNPVGGHNVEFNLVNVLAKVDLGMYFSYDGSLTTPGCNELVRWTVFKDSVRVPRSQLNKWTELVDGDGAPILFNYRSTQDLMGRTVNKSFAGAK